MPNGDMRDGLAGGTSRRPRFGGKPLIANLTTSLAAFVADPGYAAYVTSRE